MTRRYLGTRTEHGCAVSVIDANGLGHDMDLQLDVRRHSPTGFEWGYAGSGPAQLALAICVDALAGDVARAERVYQAFKFLTVVRLPHDRWTLTLDEVLTTITAIEQAQGDRATRPAGVEPF